VVRRVAIVLILVSSWCPAAFAAGDIVLRSAAEPAQAWIGQRVVLQVDVLGAQGWAQIKRFGYVDLPGAYLIRTESQGTRLQETIDGVSYTGQRYEVSVYPQKAGAIEVPPLPVEVTVKTWGAEASQTPQQLQVPAVMINARRPPGAEGVRGLVSSSRLTAAQQWTPAIEAPRVGDALKRTVITEADDVSGMAFVPLRYANLPGVGIYPAEPEVEDSVDRGSLTGRRTEAVTYVFERAGTVQIPAFELTWWNVSTQKLETVNLPGREFEVAPGLVGTVDAMGASAAQRFGARDLWLPGVLLLVSSVLLLRFTRPLVQRWNAWRRRRQESEARYFKRALSSVRSKNAGLALRDIMRWLDRINEQQAPAQVQTFVDRYADRDGQVAMNRLLDAVATDRRLADPAPLIRVLTGMRMRWREARRPRPGAAFVLPGLNGRECVLALRGSARRTVLPENPQRE
jgi:hypothetical protein